MEVQRILSDWNKVVETLHSEYKWLLFFRIPKLMQMCKYLHSDLTLEDSSHGIYHEIQFLLQRSGKGNPEKGVLKDIKVCYDRLV